MSRLTWLYKTVLDVRRPMMSAVAKPEPAKWRDDEITGSCLGHSTVLINFLGVVLLTDPVFSTRAGLGVGPFVIGPKRFIRPALKPKEVPPPDLILLSHAHFDHLDVPSLRRFSRDTPVITARATSDLLRRRCYRQIHELAWGDSTTINTQHGPVRVTALEVAHWGARMLRDDYRGYNGYLLERGGHTICFAGDTAYTSAFTQLNDPRRSLDLMLVPIGAYDPWIRAHCSPEQAAAMAEQAGAKHFVPIHHQTFKLSAEPMDEPAARIRAAFATDPERLLAVNVGETFRVPLGNRESII